MSDTFCTYGESGALYGGDDYGECGLSNVRSCISGDDPTSLAVPFDVDIIVGDCAETVPLLVPVASGPADRDFTACIGEDC